MLNRHSGALLRNLEILKYMRKNKDNEDEHINNISPSEPSQFKTEKKKKDCLWTNY